MDNKKIYIFGAGLAGCTMARLFADQDFKVHLFEQKDFIGGNCYDYQNVDGIYIHEFGPHIFHTAYDEVWEFVNRFTTFNGYKNKVKANILENQRVVSFPINFTSIEELFEEQQAKDIIWILKNKYPDKKSITIQELKDSNISELDQFSSFIYENVYSNYTAKMWGIKIEDINPDILKRVKINLDYSDNYFPDDKYQGLPTNGYTKMMMNIINHRNIKLTLNFDFNNKVKFQDEKVYLDNQQIDGHIFYCGSIDELFNYEFGELSYRSLNIEFERYTKKHFYQDVGVINYPWHPTMTRICEYKYLSKQENIHNTVISKEYPGKWDKNDKKFATRFYPIENDQNKEIYQKYLDLLNKYNVIPLGRLANYKYFDMDDTIFNSMRIFNSLINKN